MGIKEKGTAPGNSFLESLTSKFNGSMSNFVLGNVEAFRNFPIVYCSDGFCLLTGFSRKEIMQRSCECAFLFGINTDYNEVSKMRDMMLTKQEFKTEIYLHKKNGSPFLCLLDVIPIRNERQEVVLFLVSHKEISPHERTLHDKSDETILQTQKKGRKFSRDVLFHLQRQYQGESELPDLKKLPTFQKRSAKVKKFQRKVVFSSKKLGQMRKNEKLFQHRATTTQRIYDIGIYDHADDLG